MPKSTKSSRDDKERREEKSSKRSSRSERGDSRERKSGSRRDRSRSEERSSKSGDRKSKDRIKRRSTDGEVGSSSTTSYSRGIERAGDDALPNSQPGAGGFSQFPGQYDAALPGAPSTGPVGQSYGPAPLSNHVPDMFPGQFPTGSSAPYRPPDGAGLAADYYNDNGESVQHQPGVRPAEPTLIVGTQPHLMAASPVAAPPLEPSATGGTGAAAAFYSGQNFASPSTSPKPNKPTDPISAVSPHSTSGFNFPGAGLGAAAVGAAAAGYMLNEHSSSQHQATYTSGHGHSSSFPNGSGSKPPRPEVSPRHSPSNFGTAATAAGAAGLAAAAYNHHQHHHENHNNGYYSGGGGGGGYNSSDMMQRRRRRGPMSRFVDFFRDPDGVARYEEYSEYVGVCRYCFEPGSSPRDAPRKHHYHRRRSFEKHGSSTRVDKEYRYYNEDSKRRNKDKDTSWVASAATGLGLAAAGKAIFGNNRDFDDTYSVHSGKLGASSSSVNLVRRYSSDDGKSLTRRGTIGLTESDMKKVRIDSYEKDTKSSRSGKEKKRKSSESKSGLTEGMVGATVAAAAIGSEIAKRSSSPKSGRSGGKIRSSSSERSKKRKPRRSSPRREESPGFFAGLFESPPAGSRSRPRKKSNGFFSFSNGSSSSVSSRPGRNESDSSRRKKSSRKIKSTDEAKAAVVSLGAAAATLSALEGHGSSGSRRGRVVAVKESKGKDKEKSRRHDREHGHASGDDMWEDASEDEVDFGLAYDSDGSHASLSKASGTNKWDWRWKRSPSPEHRGHGAGIATAATAGLAGAAVGAAIEHHERDKRDRKSDGRYYEPGSRKIEAQGPVPIQQPQPIAPVSTSVYRVEDSYDTRNYGQYDESGPQYEFKPKRDGYSGSRYEEGDRRQSEPHIVNISPKPKSKSDSVRFNFTEEQERRHQEQEDAESERINRRGSEGRDPEKRRRKRRESSDDYSEHSERSERSSREERRSSKGRSWEEEALMGAAGVAVGAAVAGELKHKSDEKKQRRRSEDREETRKARDSYESRSTEKNSSGWDSVVDATVASESTRRYKPPVKYDDDPHDDLSDVQRDELIEQRERTIARRAANLVKRAPSPAHEDYASYFVPDELKYSSSRDRDAEGDSRNGPQVVTIEPRGSSDASKDPPFAGLEKFPEEPAVNLALLNLPWRVPPLRLINPTPPPPLVTEFDKGGAPVRRDLSHDSEEEVESKTAKRGEADFDESETREYESVTVEEERGEPTKAGKKSKTRSTKKEAKDVESPAEEVHRDHIPGAFEDDIDFAATIAAGLEQTGFDPNIAINDPQYRRRDSPPGSNDDSFYQQPFYETVSDIAMGRRDPEPPSRQHGWVEDEELPPTPKDEARSATFDGEDTEKASTSSRKKDKKDKKKKRSSLNKSTSVDDYEENDRKNESATLGADDDGDAELEIIEAASRAGSEDEAEVATSKETSRSADAWTTNGSRDQKSNGTRDYDDSKDDVYESPADDAASVASAPTAVGEESRSKKSKKKKRRSVRDDDDTASVVSSPAKIEPTRNGSSSTKKGGIFGLFSKAVDDAAENRRAKEEFGTSSERGTEDRKGKSRSDKSRDADEDKESSRKSKKKEKRRSRQSMDDEEEDAGRSSRDLSSKEQAEIDTSELALRDGSPGSSRTRQIQDDDEEPSFLGERPKPAKPPDLAGERAEEMRGREPASQERKSSFHSRSGSSQPAFGESSPDPAFSTPEQPRRQSMMVTTVSGLGGFSASTPSPTAVPIPFLRRPSAAGGAVRSTSATPLGSPSSATRPRKSRPQSSEFNSKEFRPLFLVERHQSKEVVPTEEAYPSLPSSHSNSRSSSVHSDSEGEQPLALDDSLPRDRAESETTPKGKFKGRALDLSAAKEAGDDLLDSEQVTPTVASFDADRRKKRERDALEQAMQEHVTREAEWNQRHSGEYVRRDAGKRSSGESRLSDELPRDDAGVAMALGAAALVGAGAVAALGEHDKHDTHEESEHSEERAVEEDDTKLVDEHEVDVSRYMDLTSPERRDGEAEVLPAERRLSRDMSTEDVAAAMATIAAADASPDDNEPQPAADPEAMLLDDDENRSSHVNEPTGTDRSISGETEEESATSTEQSPGMETDRTETERDVSMEDAPTSEKAEDTEPTSAATDSAPEGILKRKNSKKNRNKEKRRSVTFDLPDEVPDLADSEAQSGVAENDEALAWTDEPEEISQKTGDSEDVSESDLTAAAEDTERNLPQSEEQLEQESKLPSEDAAAQLESTAEEAGDDEFTLAGSSSKKNTKNKGKKRGSKGGDGDSWATEPLEDKSKGTDEILDSSAAPAEVEPDADEWGDSSSKKGKGKKNKKNRQASLAEESEPTAPVDEPESWDAEPSEDTREATDTTISSTRAIETEPAEEEWGVSYGKKSKGKKNKKNRQTLLAEESEPAAPAEEPDSWDAEPSEDTLEAVEATTMVSTAAVEKEPTEEEWGVSYGKKGKGKKNKKNRQASLPEPEPPVPAEEPESWDAAPSEDTMEAVDTANNSSEVVETEPAEEEWGVSYGKKGKGKKNKKNQQASVPEEPEPATLAEEPESWDAAPEDTIEATDTANISPAFVETEPVEEERGVSYGKKGKGKKNKKNRQASLPEEPEPESAAPAEELEQTPRDLEEQAAETEVLDPPKSEDALDQDTADPEFAEVEWEKPKGKDKKSKKKQRQQERALEESQPDPDLVEPSVAPEEPTSDAQTRGLEEAESSEYDTSTEQATQDPADVSIDVNDIPGYSTMNKKQKKKAKAAALAAAAAAAIASAAGAGETKPAEDDETKVESREAAAEEVSAAREESAPDTMDLSEDVSEAKPATTEETTGIDDNDVPTPPANIIGDSPETNQEDISLEPAVLPKEGSFEQLEEDPEFEMPLTKAQLKKLKKKQKKSRDNTDEDDGGEAGTEDTAQPMDAESTERSIGLDDVQETADEVPAEVAEPEESASDKQKKKKEKKKSKKRRSAGFDDDEAAEEFNDAPEEMDAAAADIGDKSADAEPVEDPPAETAPEPEADPSEEFALPKRKGSKKKKSKKAVIAWGDEPEQAEGTNKAVTEDDGLPEELSTAQADDADPTETPVDVEPMKDIAAEAAPEPEQDPMPEFAPPKRKGSKKKKSKKEFVAWDDDEEQPADASEPVTEDTSSATAVEKDAAEKPTTDATELETTVSKDQEDENMTDVIDLAAESDPNTVEAKKTPDDETSMADDAKPLEEERTESAPQEEAQPALQQEAEPDFEYATPKRKGSKKKKKSQALDSWNPEPERPVQVDESAPPQESTADLGMDNAQDQTFIEDAAPVESEQADSTEALNEDRAISPSQGNDIADAPQQQEEEPSFEFVPPKRKGSKKKKKNQKLDVWADELEAPESEKTDTPVVEEVTSIETPAEPTQANEDEQAGTGGFERALDASAEDVGELVDEPMEIEQHNSQTQDPESQQTEKRAPDDQPLTTEREIPTTDKPDAADEGGEEGFGWSTETSGGKKKKKQRKLSRVQLLAGIFENKPENANEDEYETYPDTETKSVDISPGAKPSEEAEARGMQVDADMADNDAWARTGAVDDSVADVADTTGEQAESAPTEEEAPVLAEPAAESTTEIEREQPEDDEMERSVEPESVPMTKAGGKKAKKAKKRKSRQGADFDSDTFEDASATLADTEPSTQVEGEQPVTEKSWDEEVLEEALAAEQEAEKQEHFVDEQTIEREAPAEPEEQPEEPMFTNRKLSKAEKKRQKRLASQDEPAAEEAGVEAETSFLEDNAAFEEPKSVEEETEEWPTKMSKKEKKKKRKSQQGQMQAMDDGSAGATAQEGSFARDIQGADTTEAPEYDMADVTGEASPPELPSAEDLERQQLEEAAGTDAPMDIPGSADNAQPEDESWAVPKRSKSKKSKRKSKQVEDWDGDNSEDRTKEPTSEPRQEGLTSTERYPEDISKEIAAEDAEPVGGLSTKQEPETSFSLADEVDDAAKDIAVADASEAIAEGSLQKDAGSDREKAEEEEWGFQPKQKKSKKSKKKSSRADSNPFATPPPEAAEEETTDSIMDRGAITAEPTDYTEDWETQRSPTGHLETERDIANEDFADASEQPHLEPAATGEQEYEPGIDSATVAEEAAWVEAERRAMAGLPPISEEAQALESVQEETGLAESQQQRATSPDPVEEEWESQPQRATAPDPVEEEWESQPQRATAPDPVEEEWESQQQRATAPDPVEEEWTSSKKKKKKSKKRSQSQKLDEEIPWEQADSEPNLADEEQATTSHARGTSDRDLTELIDQESVDARHDDHVAESYPDDSAEGSNKNAFDTAAEAATTAAAVVGGAALGRSSSGKKGKKEKKKKKYAQFEEEEPRELAEDQSIAQSSEHLGGPERDPADAGILRDSAVYIDAPDSPPMQRSVRDIRDSGYQGSPMMSKYGQLDDDYEQRKQGAYEATSTSPKSASDIAGRNTSRSPGADSLERPVRESIEVDPAYGVGSPRHDRDVSPVSPRSPGDMELPETRSREVSPVEPTTRDRASSALFSSSPSTRETPRKEYGGSRHMAQTFTPDRGTSEAESMYEGGSKDAESLFGGPPGVNSDESGLRSPPKTPAAFEGTPLTTITEYSPEDQHHSKHNREVSDVGQPDHGIKSRRKSTSSPQPHRHYPHRAHSPLNPEHQSARRLGHISTEDLSSRRSWSAAEDDHEIADLDRTKSRGSNRSNALSSPSPDMSRPRRPPSLPLDAIARDRRSVSGDSVRSGDSINAYIRPSPEPPHSGHHSLRRRSERSISSDLREEAKRLSQGSDASLKWDKSELGAKSESARSNEEENIVASSSSYDPTKDKGKSRITKMADVYEAYGGAQGSPRSPTRPPSMRRRQSLQILDLETRLDQLVSENRLLQDAKARAERGLDEAQSDHGQKSVALQEALQTRDIYLQQKDEELEHLKETLEGLQHQVSQLTEINAGLTAAHTARSLDDGFEEKYRQLEEEHRAALEEQEGHTRELEALRNKHTSLSGGMEGIIRQEVSAALVSKEAELQAVREELETAQQQVRTLQQQILHSRSAGEEDDMIVERDEDYFEAQCQKLCQQIQTWVLRFSKYSDTKICRSVKEINDEVIRDRYEDVMLDGSDVDLFLRDRVRRRDVFMAVVMGMVQQYVFMRYLFGMDREQRNKLKALEKHLSEVGSDAAVNRWRATTLALLTRRPAFAQQRQSDIAELVEDVYATLAKVLNPPSDKRQAARDGLVKVVGMAADLSIEMRTQRARYVMLPPLAPEFDEDGELARTNPFNASMMNERSGRFTSNEQLQADGAAVRLMLFPLVVQRDGDADADDGEDIIVCPAQVLVANDEDDQRQSRSSGKKAVRVVSAASLGTMATGPTEGGMF